MDPIVVEQPAQKTSVFYVGLAALLSGLVLGGLLVWAFMSPAWNLSSRLGQNTDQGAFLSPDTAIPLGWKSFENSEIGIAFLYPEVAGDIRIDHELGGCDHENVEYYGAEIAAKIKAELETTGDPCGHVVLSFSDQGTFLATKTPLNVKYGNARGGYWGDQVGSITSTEFIANLCDTDPGDGCRVFTTENGIQVASYVESGCDGMGCANGKHYLVRSPHRYYFGLALLAPVQGSMTVDDFDRLVNSIRFI